MNRALSSPFGGSWSRSASASRAARTSRPPLRRRASAAPRRSTSRPRSSPSRPSRSSFALTGVLSSNERTDLAANAAGRVVKTFVERGDHVAAGRRSSRSSTRAPRRSRAPRPRPTRRAPPSSSKNAQADCERYVSLLAKGAITQQEYDKQTTSCQTQAASEEAARARAAEAAQTLTDCVDPRAVRRRHRRALRPRRRLRARRHARRHAPRRRPAAPRAHRPRGQRRQRAPGARRHLRDRGASRAAPSPPP